VSTSKPEVSAKSTSTELVRHKTLSKVFGRESFRGVKLVQGRAKSVVTSSKRVERWTGNLKNRVCGRLSQGWWGKNLTTVTELTAGLT